MSKFLKGQKMAEKGKIQQFKCVLGIFQNCMGSAPWKRIFSTTFCSITKSDLSGNNAWPQASGCQKLAKMDHIGHFKLTLAYSKCKRWSLRWQCWMRLFLGFQNNFQSCFKLGGKGRRELYSPTHNSVVARSCASYCCCCSAEINSREWPLGSLWVTPAPLVKMRNR